MRLKRSILLLTGFLICLSPAVSPVLFAQGTSGIKAKVVDKDGTALPSARVTVTNAALGVTQAAVTDVNGEFRIVPLPPGAGYKIEVSFPGMGKIVLSDMELKPNKMATMPPITLRPESELTEKIKVTAKSEVINTSQTETSTSFSSEFIDSLPILGRNYQDVLTLAPGVSDVDGDGNPNIHGARDTDVNTLVDGVSTVDPLTGQVGQQLNIESIQEIEIKTSGASAEFSRGQGGFVNIVTKSGGNDFEGTFKLFYRTDKLDGDGAGLDDPQLTGGVGEIGLRDLSFNSYQPFLSLSGPIKRDKAWYFFTAEYISDEEPVNALTQAFVRTTTEKRVFGKLSWDMSTNHKLVFTATIDPQTFENQGVTSFRPIESGWTDEAGGTNIVLKETAILSPNLFLETTLQHFTTEPKTIPNLTADSNGNGILFIDRNNDGFIDGTERDPGEDFDNDGFFDIFEDFNGNGQIDTSDPPPGEDPFSLCDAGRAFFLGGGTIADIIAGDPGFNDLLGMINILTEDQDCDGRLTMGSTHGDLNGGCEGASREDLDCDGFLDNIDEDPNGNGQCDPGEPCDRDNDGRIDRGLEDRNNNKNLDDRSFPFFGTGVDDGNGFVTQNYPYGGVTPIVADRDYIFDLQSFRFSGPWFQDVEAESKRITLRQDLTLFVPDFHGQHDMKMGAKLELENFERTIFQRPIVQLQAQPANVQLFERTVGVILPAQNNNFNEAENTTFAIYVQDTYKPRPNLTLNVGLRFEREATDSFGFTSFDPAQERANFDRLQNFMGAERTKGDDLILGNNDGFTSQGFCNDPLFADLQGDGGGICGFDPGPDPDSIGLLVQDLQSVQDLAATRLTQHHAGTSVVAAELSKLFPDAVTTDPITGDELIDRDVLRAQGVVFQERESFRITNNNLAPRLAVSWDPWSDSKTRVFATWSRFYDKLFLGTVVPEEGPDTLNRYYIRDADGITGSGVPNSGIGTTISKSPPNFSMVDRGLRTPYTDEWSIGFERELAPEVSLRVSYIDRKGRDGLQDRDINHEVRLNPDDGQMVDQFGALLIATGATTGVPTADSTPDLFINNFFFNQILFLTNANESRYKGIEFQLTKRLSRKWQMDASYTYSRAQGDAEDFASILGNDPATAAFEYGPLNFDQRHVVRFSAVTFLPGDWQLGSTVQWSSGLPFSTLTTFIALDNFQFQQTRQLFGYIPLNPLQDETGANTIREFQGENRNSQRNDSFYNIDVQATKSFVIGRFNSKVFLAVENLLNTDDLTIFDFQPLQSNKALALQLNSQRRFGRRFEIGFQIEF